MRLCVVCARRGQVLSATARTSVLSSVSAWVSSTECRAMTGSIDPSGATSSSWAMRRCRSSKASSGKPLRLSWACSLLLGSVGGHQPSPTSIEQQLSGAASARATDADRPSPHRHRAQPIVVLNSISIPPRTLPGSCQCHLSHRRSVPRHNSASWAVYQPKPLHNNTRLQAEAHWWPIRAASETAPSTVRNRPPSDFLLEASGN